MPSRRAFLAAAALTAATSGCAGPADALLGVGPVVRVAVSWSAAELEAFRAVLDSLDVGYRVDLIPLGDEIATAFGSRTAHRPDVVMLPRPGLVRTHLRELDPLPDDLLPQPWPYAEVWRPMLCHAGRWYGLPFKSAHKSTVWYRRSVFDDHGLPPPQGWREWLALNRTLSERGVTPLALPGADGWMLTDFFENVLLGYAPDAYDRLTGPGPVSLSDEPAVSQALGLLGQMWASTGSADGVQRALVQQFSDAVVEVFGYQRAAMVVAPDFAEPLVRDFARGDFEIFTFPTVDEAPATPGHRSGPLRLLIGGDVAVVRAGSIPEARDLVIRLTDPQAALPWIRDYHGFLAPNKDTPYRDYTPEARKLAGQLSANGPALRFDLSDQLGPLGEGLGTVLQGFLAQVGGRGDRADLTVPVEWARRRLAELERRLGEFRG
ncbi:MAG TPA: ABC transporter substrate-binding protein [Pseudonocardiaceae bacterium]|nr:ABC transporter substrate-binding protein [Pseudonocardiaceae bacterium]